MKRIFVLIIILILFLTPALANAANGKAIQITAEDKAEIAQSILSEFDFLNRRLRQDEKKETVYLSTQNLPPNFAPQVSGINFVLLNPQEIEEKVKNGFGYFAFEKFMGKGRKVLVSFGYNFRDAGFANRNSNSGNPPDSTNGGRYEFRKVKGKWQGKSVGGYGSVSVTTARIKVSTSLFALQKRAFAKNFSVP